MLGLEILLAIIVGLGGIVVAYYVFSYFLREKTYEEALAEQRGYSGIDLVTQKSVKKEKSKKSKKKDKSDTEKGHSSSESGNARPTEKPEKKDALPQLNLPTKAEGKVRVDSGVEAAGKSTNKKVVEELHEKPAPVAKAEEQKKAVDIHGKKVEKKVVESQEQKALPDTKAPVLQQPTTNFVGATNQTTRESYSSKTQDFHQNQVVAPVKQQTTNQTTKAEIRTAPPKTSVSSDGQKEDKKKPIRATIQNGPSQDSEYNEIAGLLRTVTLTDAEIQTLLKMLITKQSERHTEWVQHGKGKSADPATVAKLLIEDKEREMREEKELNKTLVEQLKEVKNLLNLEKSRIREADEIKRKVTEKTVSLEQELRVITGRLKLADEKHAADILQWTLRVEELETRSAAVVQALQEENRRVVERMEEQLLQRPDSFDTGAERELETLRLERDRLSEEIENARLKIQELTIEQMKSIADTEVQVGHFNSNIARLEDEKQTLERDFAKLREILDGRDSQLGEKERLVLQLESQVTEKEKRLKEVVEHAEALEHQVSSLTQSSGQLKNDLQEAQNSEQRFEEAVRREKEAVARLDISKNEGFEEAKNYYEPQIAAVDHAYRQTLLRVFPVFEINGSLNAGDWLANFEELSFKYLKERQEGIEKAENLQKDLENMRTEQDLLQTEVQRYRQTLNETEEKLRDLQQSIETEEGKWIVVEKSAREYEDKCRQLETQLSQAAEEKERVCRALDERSGSLGELEHRLREAEQRLSAFSSVQSDIDNLVAEQDRLKNDLTEVQRHKDELSEEAHRLRAALEDTTHSKSLTDQRLRDLEAQHADVAELKRALEVEKENARKMAQELVKSRSVIQVGLDSLRSEEGTVQQLKEALESGENGLNGSVGPDGDHAHDLSGIVESAEESDGDRESTKRKKLKKKLTLKGLLCS